MRPSLRWGFILSVCLCQLFHFSQAPALVLAPSPAACLLGRPDMPSRNKATSEKASSAEGGETVGAAIAAFEAKLGSPFAA